MPDIKPNTPYEWGLWSFSYLTAAKTLYEIKNRKVGFWVPSYYLLYHSLELATKMELEERGRTIPANHKITKMIADNADIFTLNELERHAIEELEQLNAGPGQLRFPNRVGEQFLPSVFENASALVERWLDESGISEVAFNANDMYRLYVPKYQW